MHICQHYTSLFLFDFFQSLFFSNFFLFSFPFASFKFISMSLYMLIDGCFWVYGLFFVVLGRYWTVFSIIISSFLPLLPLRCTSCTPFIPICRRKSFSYLFLVWKISVVNNYNIPHTTFEFRCNNVVVLVSLGSKKDLRALEVVGASPKHRASIAVATSYSMDATTGNDVDYASAGISSQPIQHQLSLDQSCSTSKSSTALATNIPLTSDTSDAIDIVAESLEKILDNKLVREKRLEMEKKLESMRKKHDKEKLRAISHRSGDLTEGIRKSKFYMNNKLVKRLSNKNL